MDNLTHTIIGLIAGEAVAQSQPPARSGLPAQTRRALLIALTAIASNLPDLDLLVSYRGFSRNKLDYMLGHRGYTHTIAGSVLLAAALYVLTEAWMRWRKLEPAPRDRWILIFAAVVGTALHLGMDFLNSYGVHPFWPLGNRWYYGDSVFIVEPLYWIAAAPLLFVQKSLAARMFVGFAVAAAVALSVLTGLVPSSIVVGLVILATLLLVIGSRVSPRAASLVSLIAFLLITATFIGTGQLAAGQAERLAQASSAADSQFGRVLDHVLTPMPANPVCWDLLLLQERRGLYRVRHAVVSIAPRLISAPDCPQRMSESKTTASLVPVAAAESAATHWLGQLDMRAGTFAQLAAQYCDAAALLRFARVPFTAQMDGGVVLGDLRFDREPGLGFSELLLSGGGDRAGCKATAPWIPPREDLLR